MGLQRQWGCRGSGRVLLGKTCHAVPYMQLCVVAVNKRMFVLLAELSCCCAILSHYLLTILIAKRLMMTKVEDHLKRQTVDLEHKIQIIKKFENGQIEPHFLKQDLATSELKIILTDCECIKDHVKYSAPLKSTITTKKCVHALL
jgi:hypothetical protein